MRYPHQRRLLLAALVCALWVGLSCAPSAPSRPDILLIMADDLGFSDIGPYGGEIRTPHLDALARRGVRFLQFYNAGRCCPTRASLLTGRYSHEVGMGRMVSAVDEDPEPGPYQGFVDTTVTTLADALRGAGYGTYMSGKWHIGEKPAYWPRKQGFDRYFGLISGASSYYEILANQPRLRQMVLDDDRWTPPAEGFYMTDAITDYALSFLDEHERRRAEDPLFLYVAYTAPHWPLHAPEEDIARYADRYVAGWDALRGERYARMRKMELIDERYALSPRTEPIPAWEDAEGREDWTRRMAVYAAMVDRLDQGIGRIFDRLRAQGRLDNTLVLFLSDNGACAENIDGRNLNDPAIPVGARGSYVAYEEPWANASNTPFRLYKQWQHEGGVVTPFIVSWPGKIAQEGGVERRAVGHVIDILPTLLEAAGAPASPLGTGVLPGRSLVPVLAGEPGAARGPLFFEHVGNRAIRDGDWKLVWDRRVGAWELYDMAVDPTELHDLFDVRSDTAEALRKRWEAWAEKVGVR